MTHANLRWMLNAKRNAVAPPTVDSRDLLELEMWRAYRAQLLDELAEIDQVLALAQKQSVASADRE